MSKISLPTFCFILGTRPEIVKMFPLIKEVKSKNIPFEIIHTNQHFSYQMDEEIAHDLDLPKYNYRLDFTHSDSSSVLGNMIYHLSQYLSKNNFSRRVIVVQGDTNSTLAGAMVANKFGIPLIHLEAGFRSFINKQPEEVNRRIVDQLSDLNIAFDHTCLKNLRNEKLHQKTLLAENSAYSAADYMSKKLKLNLNNLFRSKFRLMTIHRAENTDNILKLKKLHSFALELSKEMPLLWVLHPRTIKTIQSLYNKNKPIIFDKFSNSIIQPLGEITFLQPQGYKNFFSILSQSHSVYSDSGGLVDECIYLSKHYICLRDKTEQVEVLKSKRMILLSSKLSIHSMYNKSKSFEKKPYPQLTNYQRSIKVKSVSLLLKQILKWIKEYKL